MDTGGKNNNQLYFLKPVASDKQCFHKTGTAFFD